MRISKREQIHLRAKAEARYIINTKCTIRECARVFNVSKTTVHKDMAERLKKLDHKLYKEVREVIEYNKEVCTIRGGIATRKMYMKKGYPVIDQDTWIAKAQ